MLWKQYWARKKFPLAVLAFSEDLHYQDRTNRIQICSQNKFGDNAELRRTTFKRLALVEYNFQVLPLMAQKRSAFSSLLAVRIRPSATTTVAETMLSDATVCSV